MGPGDEVGQIICACQAEEGGPLMSAGCKHSLVARPSGHQRVSAGQRDQRICHVAASEPTLVGDPRNVEWTILIREQNPERLRPATRSEERTQQNCQASRVMRIWLAGLAGQDDLWAQVTVSGEGYIWRTHVSQYI